MTFIKTTNLFPFSPTSSSSLLISKENQTQGRAKKEEATRMNSKTTLRMHLIVAVMVALSIILFPMVAEANIPTVGVIAECIKSCIRSLPSLTPGYCKNVCEAEYPPPRHRGTPPHSDVDADVDVNAIVPS